MLSDLAFALAEQGVEVEVIASRLLYDDKSARLPRSEVVRGVFVHRVKTSGLGRQRKRHQIVDYLSFLVSALWKLARVARRGDTVVVKTDPPLLSVPVSVMSSLFGWRQVNWLQDAFPEIAMAAGVSTHSRILDKLLFFVLTALRNTSMRRADSSVVLGERMHDRLLARGAPVSKLTIIPNWTDTAAIVPIVPAKNRLRERWGLQAKFVLGYSGNMGLAHDFDVMLQAAQILRDDPRFAVVLIGNGKRKGDIERTIANRRLSNVMLQPYQPRSELASSLSVADVHFVTLRSEMEGLIVPSKFYGIAAAGRPTIFLGDPDGEIARSIRRYNCGVVVAADDARGLAEAVRRYADDSKMLVEHGRNARAMVVKHFDMPVSVSKWRQLLNKN